MTKYEGFCGKKTVGKYRRHIYWVGFKPTIFAILEQMSYQLDHRDCPVARGSSNPIF